jgi:catechol 2,3-dioxygenase-like lactoylglutathione lyase family enzyme
MTQVHHTAIRVTDVERSLRFWSEGMGFRVLMDRTFEGDWPTLFGAAVTSLRSLFLGDPGSPDSGLVELVFLDRTKSEAGPPEVGHGVARLPSQGFMLVSIMTDVDATLARLDVLELGGDPRQISVTGIQMCTVVDPDGVLVELVDSAATRNLERLALS